MLIVIKQSTQLVCISQREKLHILYLEMISWNGGGYRVKNIPLDIIETLYFPLKIKGDKNNLEQI